MPDDLLELEWIETEPGVWQATAGALRLEAREAIRAGHRCWEGSCESDGYRNSWSSLEPVQCDLELHAKRANRNAGR